MASETKHVAMNEKQQVALRKAVLAICKEHNTGVAADLDSRLSYRERDPKDPKKASWGAYSRFLCDSGHTIYVDLRTMNASYSTKPDKLAQAHVEKAAAKKAKREAAKAAKAAKAAAKAEKLAVVKFDPSLPTVDAAGHTTAPKAKRSRKAKKSTEAVLSQEAE